MIKNSLLLKNKTGTLPNKIGVYLFLDKNGVVLYVGKSKFIKRRVLSYFKGDNPRASLLISSSYSVDYILVDTERDALLLENNLIKENKPKYNVLLKDDKSFSWLCLKKERFPRVFISRQKIKSYDDLYFGPYISRRVLLSIFNTIKSFYPVRTCNYNLSDENIISKKYKVCLDYHLKNCLGPCEGLQKEEDYNNNIKSIINILEGKYSFIISNLKTKMTYFSNQLEFEKANDLKNKIKSLYSIRSKTIIVTNKNINIDSFYIHLYRNVYYVNFIRVVEGAIIYIKTYKIKKSLIEAPVVVEGVINKIHLLYGSVFKIIICNIYVGDFFSHKITNPKIGYKKNILNFSFNKIKDLINKNKNVILINLKKDLFLNKVPFHIEAFDNSTLSGNNTTSSCVVFKNGVPYKPDYRHYNIKTVSGINDYLAMEEVLIRRYSYLLKNKLSLPDLIIIDGGKGQLSSAIKSLNKLNIINSVNIISIAKKEELIYLKDKSEILLDKKSDSLKLIQYLRNEAHRFCLKQHRKLRNDSFFNSEINNIKGLGKISISKLIQHFKNIKNIKSAEKEEIIKIIGFKKYNILNNYFIKC
jgi:excinuclease ABC subunit C